MKRIAILVILSLTAGSAWAQSAPPAPVVVDEARMDTFSAALEVSGTVISKHDARIAAVTDGSITWVAEVGTNIGKGEPFATIDDTDLQLDLKDNQAQLESLRAQKRYQENNLKRLNQLTASNNASVNQLDEEIAKSSKVYLQSSSTSPNSV